MAVGQVVSINSGSHKQEFVPSGAQYPTIAILNPNDGIVFVSQNRDTTGTSVGQWDYKVPSQSYAILPGPYMSVGMFYLDQSGSGAAGQITIYPVPVSIQFPDFHAIGRALQTFGSALDISEGAQPANPGAGLLRLWADTNNDLHELSPGGVDATVIDSNTPLGGMLSGFLPNGLVSLPYLWATLSSVSIANPNAWNVVLDIGTIQAGTYFEIAICNVTANSAGTPHQFGVGIGLNTPASLYSDATTVAPADNQPHQVSSVAIQVLSTSHVYAQVFSDLAGTASQIMVALVRIA